MARKLALTALVLASAVALAACGGEKKDEKKGTGTGEKKSAIELVVKA